MEITQKPNTDHQIVQNTVANMKLGLATKVKWNIDGW